MIRIILALLNALTLLSISLTSLCLADTNPVNTYNHPPFGQKKSHFTTITLPADPDPQPYFPTKQKSYCRIWKFTGPHMRTPSFAHFMQLDKLHKIATGKGQKIAIIDTGITPNGRYRNLIDGGDYIAHDSGLNDCSGHGSLVAGLIGAMPTRSNNFVGIAPDAQIISIRVAADNLYEYNLTGHITDQELREHPLGGMTELAHAIVHAANLGATIINISLAKCSDIFTPPDTHELRNALLYAVQIKHIVIVAASGNSDDTIEGRGCKNNPSFDPAQPTDIRNWSGLINLSFPSYYQPLVLSVGSTDNKAVPLVSSLLGPWVDVSAPGYHITSFNRDISAGKPRYVNAQYDPETKQLSPINGTSFATPLVTGLVALIRERFPDLSPWQVMDRIESTAHHPDGGQNNFVGYGVIDATAALTAHIPRNSSISPQNLPNSIALPPQPPITKDNTALIIAVYISSGSLLCMISVGISLFLRKKPQR